MGRRINLNELKNVVPGLLPMLNAMSRMTYGKDLDTIVLESNNGSAEEALKTLLLKIYQNEEIPRLLLSRVKN